MELWRGSISTRNGALQLLLLVDYIFDWARDVYRDYIIQELRTLSSGENDAAGVVYSDTDIHSTRQLEYSMFPDQEDIKKFEDYISRIKKYTALDSAEGIVRHATFVESRYCAILVTPDNVQTLLQSMQQTRTQQLCRLILGQMSDSIILDLPTLRAMEEQWTGNARVLPPGYLVQTKFYSVVSCTNYLSGNWHQVRELYIIAIAEDAWTAIVDASKLKKNRGKAKKPTLTDRAIMGSMLTTLKRLQAGSLAETLLAAITRRAVKISTRFTDESSVITGTAEKSSINPSALDNNMNLSTSALCEAVPDDGTFRDIVHYIYKFFKKGNLEPQEPFMRISKRFDQQHLLQSDVEPIATRDAPLQVSAGGCVLISSACHSHDPERSKSEVCVYIVDGEPTIPTQEQLFKMLMNTVETRDVYHTTQDNGTSNLTNIKRVPWNLEQTYAIYSGKFEFFNFLSLIGKKIGNYSMPATQGSLRASAESGSYLFTRNLFPWQDPRRIVSDVEGRMFIVYKLMTSEISFWKMIAEELSAKGITCCKICATPTEDSRGMCFRCFTTLKDPDSPCWLRNILQGKLPFSEDRDGYDSEDISERFLDSGKHQDWWKESLAGYRKLDDEFKNLGELSYQWIRFINLTSENLQARWMKLGMKRKRGIEDGEVKEERQRYVKSEVIDK